MAENKRNMELIREFLVLLDGEIRSPSTPMPAGLRRTLRYIHTILREMNGVTATPETEPEAEPIPV